MDKHAANIKHSCFTLHTYTTHEFQNKVAFFKVGDKFTIFSLHQETIPFNLKKKKLYFSEDLLKANFPSLTLSPP